MGDKIYVAETQVFQTFTVVTLIQKHLGGKTQVQVVQGLFILKIKVLSMTEVSLMAIIATTDIMDLMQGE